MSVDEISLYFLEHDTIATLGLTGRRDPRARGFKPVDVTGGRDSRLRREEGQCVLWSQASLHVETAGDCQKFPKAVIPLQEVMPNLCWEVALTLKVRRESHEIWDPLR